MWINNNPDRIIAGIQHLQSGLISPEIGFATGATYLIFSLLTRYKTDNGLQKELSGT